MENLRKLRMEEGLTQQDMAALLGVSRTAYGKWENGDREPDLSTLQILAKHFHTTTDYLIGINPFKNYTEEVNSLVAKYADAFRAQENNDITLGLVTNKFPNRYVKLLEAKKITMQDIEKRGGVDVNTSKKIVNDGHHELSPIQVLTLANIFGVTFEYLAGLDGPELYAERLKYLRLQNRKESQEIATLIGESMIDYVSWESGAVQPEMSVIDKLSKLFHVTSDYLLGNVNDPQMHVDNERMLREINSYEDNGQKTEASSIGGLESDPLLAFYGDVKEHLSQDDLDDIRTIMEAKAKRNKEKKNDESGRKNL